MSIVKQIKKISRNMKIPRPQVIPNKKKYTKKIEKKKKQN